MPVGGCGCNPCGNRFGCNTFGTGCGCNTCGIGSRNTCGIGCGVNTCGLGYGVGVRPCASVGCTNNCGTGLGLLRTTCADDTLYGGLYNGRYGGCGCGH